MTADGDSLKKLRPLHEKFSIKVGLNKLLPGHHYTIEELSPYISQFEDCTSRQPQILKVAGQTGYSAVVIPAPSYLTRKVAAKNIYAPDFQIIPFGIKSEQAAVPMEQTDG